jgi:predicted 2-oxoglutarate/Fe(II)-dependent dioxygenase YbiX
MPAVSPAVSPRRLRVAARLLEPGGRFPNFAIKRVGRDGQPGPVFEYYRDVTAGPSVILLGRPAPAPWHALDAGFARHGANLMAVAVSPGNAAGLPERLVLMADQEAKLRLRLLDGAAPPAEPTIIVVDANQRILAHRHDPDAAALAAWALARLDELIEPAPAIMRATAPVLMLERVLEPAFCRRLIETWAADNEEGRVSAIIDGKPASLLYEGMKRRRDHMVRHPSPLYDDITDQIARKISGEIFKSFQFDKLRAGQYYIACYDAARGDYFRAHRDNTTPQTAKRRFALTVNLNEDYDGGELAFPEFGPQGYRTAAGGGIVFSCSLMHEARPVTRGRRYALLAFLIEPD